MKTPSTDLHELILSMSKHEKRHFKLVSKAFQRESGTIYLQLFEAISKQQHYNEAILKKGFADRLNDNRFSVAKNYLYHHLLKALNILHNRESINRKIRMTLDFVQVLYKRELYSQAEKQLKKAEKLLQLIDHPILWLEYLEWKFRLQKANLFLGLPEKEFAAFQSQFEQIQGRVNDYMDLFAGYAEFRFYRGQDGYIRVSKAFQERSKTILEGDSFLSPPKGLSPRAQIMYHHLWGIYHYVHGRFQESFSFYQTLFNLFQKAPHLAQEHPHQFSGALFDYGIVALQIGDFNTLSQVIDGLEAMEQGGVRQMARVFCYLNVLKIRTILDSLSLEFVNLDIEEIVVKIEGYRTKLNQMEIYGSFFHLALLAFYRGNFSLSLKLIASIINDKDLHLVPEVYLITRLVRLVIHLELKNYDLIEALGQNVYRYISGHDSKFKLEGFVANTFGKFLDMRNQKEQHDFLRKFREELQSFFQTPGDKHFAHYFDFDSWIESRLEGKRLVEVIREKVEENFS